MKPLRYHPESKAESREAIDWYWDRSRVAALDFANELKSALLRLRKAPNTCSPYLHGTRRILLNRFPFFIVFRERLRDIQIIAIAHAKRRPGYWKKRLKQ
jgi:plasmid stabilization system protein ParE